MLRYADVPGVGSVSRLVLGTMAYTPERQDQADSLLDAFLEIGGNCLDTAHNYGGEWVGNSERAIGNWLRKRGNRDGLLILTKGCHPDEHGPRVNAQALASDLNDSLERLGVDHVDLYMLHRDDTGVPVGPIMEALNEHIRSGRIRAIGASNWTCARIDEANAYASAHGLHGFVASSINLSLAHAKEARWAGCVSAAQAERDWHRRTGMPLFSWSAQASGFFTGRYSPDRPDDPEMVRVYYSPENWERYRRAEELARRKGVTATQIALAFVLNQSFPTFALFGPLTIEEFSASVKAEDLSLTPEEVRWLDLEA